MMIHPAHFFKWPRPVAAAHRLASPSCSFTSRCGEPQSITIAESFELNSLDYPTTEKVNLNWRRYAMQYKSMCPIVFLSTSLCLMLIVFSLTARSVTQATALVINEYLADPPDGLSGDANGDGARDSTADEFVEIVNASAAPLNIGGFSISDSAQVRLTIPAGKIIPPGEAAVVFGGGMPAGEFGNAAENGLVFSIGGAGLSLNNAGDTITIKDSSNQVVATLSFGASEGNANQSITRSPEVIGNFTPHSSAAGSQGALFSPGARANGQPFTTTAPVIDLLLPDAVVVGDEPLSLIVKGSNYTTGSEAQIDGVAVQTFFLSATELEAEVPPLFRSAPALRAVTVRNPDGALSNQAVLTVLAAVGINEFLADPPDGPLGDANGDGARSSSDDEFIEIINRTAAPADVGGFSLRDGDGTRLTFPPGTVIPANETAVIFGGGSPTGEFGNAQANELVFTAALSLNNTGDAMTLIDREARAVETVTYGAAEGNANQSINRNPDSAGSRFAPHSTIAGSGGRLYSPGAQINGSPFTTAPRIVEISPTSAPLDSPPFDATVRGSGFDTSSIAFIDSAPVATLFVSPAELIIRVPGGVTSVAGQHRLHIKNEGGNRSNAVTLTIIPPPPILSAALPRVIISGTGAFTLFLLGENFEPGSRALVDDLPVATTFVSRRELRAAISAALVSTPGSHNIRVRNGDGQLSEEKSFEVVLPASRITSIFPAQAIAGSPQFSLTIAGSNFMRGTAVSFGDMLIETAFISATELRAEVPASLIEMPGLRAVRVHNGTEAASNEAVFRVLPDAPVIHALEPESVIEGAGEVSIEIAGAKFRPGATVHASRDGQANSIRSFFISESRIGAILPASLTQTVGTVLLRIENPDSGVSNDAQLRIIARDPLVINEFLADPPDGLSGDANNDGERGTNQDEFIEVINRTAEPMDISGFTLSDADGLRHVFASGSVLPPFEVAVVFGGGSPRGLFGNASATGLVFVASSGGLSLNNGGDTIKLADDKGGVIQEIKFGPSEGNAGQSINRDPDASGLDFAPHTAVARDVRRLFSPGAKVDGQAFTTRPAIHKLEPAVVRRGARSFTLVITGANFLPGAVVSFDEAVLQTRYISDLRLEAEVSESLTGEGGLASVRVRNPKGELSGGAKLIIEDDPPVITKIDPAKTGTRAEGFELAIEADRLQRGATVMVGGERFDASLDERGVLKARLPDRLFERAASHEVRIINADGNRSNIVMLKVENGPLITRLSPRRIKAGKGEIEMSFKGLAFKPGVTLFIGERAVPTTFIRDTDFTARIPEDAAKSPGTITVQARHGDGGRSNRVSIKVVE
jgi:hypothetical protein